MQILYCDVCGAKLPELDVTGNVEVALCEKCAAVRNNGLTTPTEVSVGSDARKSSSIRLRAIGSESAGSAPPPSQRPSIGTRIPVTESPRRKSSARLRAITPDRPVRPTPAGGTNVGASAPAKTPTPPPSEPVQSAPGGSMGFYFCEKCGKRVTSADLARGQGRDKQLKGVHCAACSEGTMTVAFDAISKAEIWKDEQARRQGQRRSTSTRLSVAKPAGAAPRREFARLAAFRSYQANTAAIWTILAVILFGAVVGFLFIGQGGSAPAGRAESNRPPDISGGQREPSSHREPSPDLKPGAAKSPAAQQLEKIRAMVTPNLEAYAEIRAMLEQFPRDHAGTPEVEKARTLRSETETACVKLAEEGLAAALTKARVGTSKDAFDGAESQLRSIEAQFRDGHWFASEGKDAIAAALAEITKHRSAWALKQSAAAANPQPAIQNNPQSEISPSTSSGLPLRSSNPQSENAIRLFAAICKETAPLLTENQFADALALLDRKIKDPNLADASELLKQEQADIGAVVELRKEAVEALRKKVGEQVSLKKGNGVIKGKVVAEAKPDVVTVNVGGPEVSLRADQVEAEDIERYAPKGAGGTPAVHGARPSRPPDGNSPAVLGEDLRRRGLLYLYAGQIAKAKEYFEKSRTAGFQPAGAEESGAKMAAVQGNLDRIAGLELGDVEAGALCAWENAEKLFAARNFKGAKDAYDAFVQAHGQTKTYAAKAEALKERQAVIDKAIGPATALTVDLGGGVKMEFVLVKPGEFMMGGPGKRERDWQGNEGPIHKVTITKPFYIGKYPVTVAQFAKFVESEKYVTECEKGGNKGWAIKNGRWGEQTGVNWRTPSFEQTPDHPVVLVSWNDTQEFCKWASKVAHASGLRGEIRLPTEALWEWAARGPKSMEYPFGEKWDGLKVNHRDAALRKSGFQEGNCSNDNDGYAYTSPVGKFANASWCGAFDMSGNVWQWVQDWEADYTADAQVDPIGPANGQRRVVRGGSWSHDPTNCRAASRERHHPGFRPTYYGFRVVVVSGPP